MSRPARHLPLLAAILLTAGCTPRSAPSLERVTFAMPAYLSSAVGYIALERGFFADEGLDVELVVWNRDGATLPALAQGAIDVTTSGHLGPKYFNVVARGGRVRFVAAAAVYATDGCPYYAIVARRELVESGRLTDFASLRGLRISSERTAATYYVWSRVLAGAGLSMDDVELVDIPATTKLDALARGLIDVTTASEPWVTRLVASGHGTIWHPISDVLPEHQSTYVMFGSRLLDERPDLGRRFLAAYLRAVAAYLDEGKSERHLEIVARATRHDRAQLEAMCWSPWSRDGRIDRSTLDEFQRWALAEGLVDRSIDVESMIDESFLPGVEAAEPIEGEAAS
jgi:NitT/TauT family transport system substrate-binding protein